MRPRKYYTVHFIGSPAEAVRDKEEFERSLTACVELFDEVERSLPELRAKGFIRLCRLIEGR